MRRRQFLVGLVAVVLVAAPRLWADGRLVLDVQAGPEDGLFHHAVVISPPEVETSFFAAVGPILFFSADDGVHGGELWRSDGSPEGTRLVKDIRPGPDSSLGLPPNPRTSFQPPLLTVAGNQLFFDAFEPDLGRELWVVDLLPLFGDSVVAIPSLSATGMLVLSLLVAACGVLVLRRLAGRKLSGY